MALVAYIYDKNSGLLARHVVSDDYADEAAFRAIHIQPNEDAVITQREQLVLTDPIALAKESRSEDEIQDIITKQSGIEPPPKVRYAFVDQEGIVFDVLVTRRIDDVRLSFNKTVPDFAAKPHADAMPKDKINLDGSLVKYVPKPADMAQPDVTIAELIAQRDATLK